MLLHNDIVGVSVRAHIQGERESKDTTRTQGRSGLCLCWRCSSEAIWLHSCALPPSLSPVFPPLAPYGTLAGLDRNRSSILPQQTLMASSKRGWAHTLIKKHTCSILDNVVLQDAVAYPSFWTHAYIQTERNTHTGGRHLSNIPRTLWQHTDTFQSELIIEMHCVEARKHLPCPLNLSLLRGHLGSISPWSRARVSREVTSYCGYTNCSNALSQRLCALSLSQFSRGRTSKALQYPCSAFD